MTTKKIQNIIALFIATSLVLVASRSALAAQDMALVQLKGDWVSVSDSQSNGLTGTLSWHPAFAGKFYLVEYQLSIMSDDSEKTVFSGLAYYKNESGPTLSAFWVDSQGELLPIQAEIDGSDLMANWGVPGGKQGRTQYRMAEPEKLIVTDWIESAGAWKQFRKMEYRKKPMQKPSTKKTGPRVTGIGGIFFRGKDPDGLSAWYEDMFGVNRTPTSYDDEPWTQEAGETVFAPFSHDTEYFGKASQQWMINFRVTDLDEMVSALQAKGVEVKLDPETYPNGRFARLIDPEGNPIELWEPKKK